MLATLVPVPKSDGRSILCTFDTGSSIYSDAEKWLKCGLAPYDFLPDEVNRCVNRYGGFHTTSQKLRSPNCTSTMHLSD